MALEEDRFITGFHQQVQKALRKAWHDKNIRQKVFREEYLFLLYEIKFPRHQGKFKMHWLGPYFFKEITDGGVVHLATLSGENLLGYVNGSRLKPYRDDHLPSCTLKSSVKALQAKMKESAPQ